MRNGTTTRTRRLAGHKEVLLRNAARRDFRHGAVDPDYPMPLRVRVTGHGGYSPAKFEAEMAAWEERWEQRKAALAELLAGMPEPTPWPLHDGSAKAKHRVRVMDRIPRGEDFRI